jgi:hypothetical protein
MNAMRTNIIARALRYVGIREVPSGSNRTPFGVKFGMNGVAWCQIFDWIVLHECGAATPKTASTMAQVAYARAHKLWHAGLAGIQPGDSIYFHWSSSSRPKSQPDHVEIVRALISGGVQDVGGNVSDGVTIVNRRANILGYIRWPALDKAAPVVPVDWIVGDTVTPKTGSVGLRHHVDGKPEDHSFSALADEPLKVTRMYHRQSLVVDHLLHAGWVYDTALKKVTP